MVWTVSGSRTSASVKILARPRACLKYRFHALFDISVPIKIDQRINYWYATQKSISVTFFPPEMLFVAFPVCTGSNRPLLLIIVYPNKGGVAGYGNRKRGKYTAKWGLQIAEMIFQIRSSNLKARKAWSFAPLYPYITYGLYRKNVPRNFLLWFERSLSDTS